MIAVTFFWATNSVFNKTNQNNSFLNSIPGYWTCRGGTETSFKLQEILELREEIDYELHVKEVKKRGNHIKIGDKKKK